MPSLIGLLLVIGIPVVVVQRATGLPLGYAAVVTIALVVIGIAALAARARRQKAARRAALVAKYGSEKEADMIMDRQIWTGMTAEQLVDCLGQPEGVDYQVSARKQKEVWKYGRIGQNRFRNRITVEKGQVVGWTAR
jgi:hypothetical protein